MKFNSINEVLEGGTVIEAHDTCLAVEVEGVEVYVGATVTDMGGCSHCTTARGEFDISYNRKTEDRIKKHGEADPLGLNE